MKPLAVLAAACLACTSTPVLAQASAGVATQEGFAYCSVTDTGSAQAKVWASPVFAFRHRSEDPGGFQRLNEIAGEFLQQVNARGGAGSKMCSGAATRAGAEAAREQERAIWDKRMYFVKIGDWREVAWTPAPWDPASTAAAPAEQTRYFVCSAVQTDVPGRIARSRAVVTQVFERPVPSAEPAGMYTRAQAYGGEFQAIAQAHGVQDPNPGCIPFETRGEADKWLVDQRRLLDGFNQDYQEIRWQPLAPTAAPQASVMPAEVPALAAPAAAAVAPTPAPSPSASAAAAPAPAPLPAGPAAGAKPAADADLLCTAFLTRTQPALLLRAPAQAQASPSTEPALLAATLARFVQAMQSQHAGKWYALKPASCYPNSAVFAGETFCFTAENKHFGGMQSAGMFCNTSRKLLEQRWQDMQKADGGQALIVAWP